MMGFELNKRYRRALAVSLLAACVLLLLTLVVVPVFQSILKLNRETAESLNRYNRYRSIQAAKGNLQKALTAINGQELDSYLYPPNNLAVALSTIQVDVRRIIESNGGKVDNSIALDSKQEKLYRRLGSKFEFKASIKNLTHILFGLETAHPLLKIDKVHIFTDQNQSGDQEPTLHVRMSIYGYMQGAS